MTTRRRTTWRAARPATRHRRRELELIALRLFTEQGFDDTTVDQIAAEAGVSSGTFFRYFELEGQRAVERVRHEVDDASGPRWPRCRPRCR